MHHLLEIWFSWVLTGGYVGIIVLMAMGSTPLPVPAEVVLPPAAFLAAQGKLNPAGVILAGTVGAYLGAAFMYWISRWIGRPLILRFGRFILCQSGGILLVVTVFAGLYMLTVRLMKPRSGP